VGGHGVDRYAERVGDLLVDLAVGDVTDYVFLALAQRADRSGGVGVIIVRRKGSAVEHGTQVAFEILYGRDEELVLDIEMSHHVALTHYYVEQGGAKPRILVLLVMIDEYILELVEFGGHMTVVVGEGGYREVFVDAVFEKSPDISENDIVLMIHVVADLDHIIVEKLHQQKRHLVGFRAVYGLDQTMPDIGKRHIEKRGMRA